MKTLIRRITLTVIILCSPAGHAYADIAEDLGGQVQATIQGEVVNFPVLKTDVKADIQGDLATIHVIQTFQNPTDIPLNAKYLFPLNKDSAVYAMTMEVGDEIVEAQIKRKEEAKKTFEKAKAKGKAASLLVQHRPNMFTQNIANLMPDMPIKVTLKYVQTVPKIDEAYELVVPLVVGPRYQPAGAGEVPDIIDNGANFGKEEISSRGSFGKWELEELPDYPDVAGLNLPKNIEEDRVSISINITSDIPIQNIRSRTHAVSQNGDDNYKTVTLQKGRVIDNADFVLRYGLNGDTTQAGFLATQDERGGFFSLMIEPPEMPKANQITAREMVFVLDTSGSMHGQPIDASKTFMTHALKNLRQGDSFRVIRFSDNATEFASRPVAATQNNINDGLNYVRSLNAGGGTNVPAAITQAFSTKEQDGVLRIVVFLTDGYIGNEASVLSQIEEKIGSARIYAFGVGTSVNRYLLSEMGRRGRGFARFIDPTEDVHDAAITLAQKLNAPVLTDIKIDWGTMLVEELTPEVIPDLFAGDSIRVQGKFKSRGSHEIRVNGKVKGARASMPLQITLPANNNSESAESIPLIWARSKIADNMRLLNTSHRNLPENVTHDSLKENVTNLGLEFSLMTKWTSFVAVSKKIYNNTPEKTKNTKVPLPMVKGVSKHAYAKNFSGGSVPEPASTGGLIVLGGAACAALRRRRKKMV